METGSLPPWMTILLSIGAALLGALVGGLASYLANIALQHRARRARAAIRRKSKLYTPLRRELLALAKDLDADDPVGSIQTSRGFIGGPAFWLWGEMKEDSRASSVARRRYEDMEKLLGLVDRYNDAVEEAGATLEAIVNEAWTKMGSSASKIFWTNGRTLAEFLLSGPPVGVGHLAGIRGGTLVPPESSKTEDVHKVAARLSQAVEESQDFERSKKGFLSARQALLDEIAEMVKAFDAAMERIARKYEREPEED